MGRAESRSSPYHATEHGRRDCVHLCVSPEGHARSPSTSLGAVRSRLQTVGGTRTLLEDTQRQVVRVAATGALVPAPAVLPRDRRSTETRHRGRVSPLPLSSLWMPRIQAHEEDVPSPRVPHDQGHVRGAVALPGNLSQMVPPPNLYEVAHAVAERVYEFHYHDKRCFRYGCRYSFRSRTVPFLRRIPESQTSTGSEVSIAAAQTALQSGQVGTTPSCKRWVTHFSMHAS